MMNWTTPSCTLGLLLCLLTVACGGGTDPNIASNSPGLPNSSFPGQIGYPENDPIYNPGSPTILPANILIFNSFLGRMAILPDGRKLYAVDKQNNSLSVFDLAQERLIKIVPVGIDPRGVAVSPDGKIVCVANHDTLSIIQVSTDSVVATIQVAPSPNAIIFSPDSKNAYVIHPSEGSLSLVDVEGKAVVDTLAVGTSPQLGVLTADGLKLYITVQGEDHVASIDTAAFKVSSTIAVESDPIGIVLSGDGTQVFVANRGSNTISRIDVQSDRVVGSPIEAGQGPVGMVLNPDDSVLYVANLYKDFDSDEFGCLGTDTGDPSYGNTVSMIDVASGTRLKPDVTVALAPTAMAVIEKPNGPVLFSISPCQALLSVVDPSTSHVLFVQLDAASSALALSPSGKSLYVGHTHAVSIVDIDTDAVTRMAARGAGPSMLLVASNNNRLYAARPNANDILALDLSNHSLAGTFDELFYPGDMALTPDGQKLIVAETGFSGRPGTTVSILDTATFTTTAVLPANDGPIRVAVDSSGKQAYVTNFGDLIPVSTSLPEKRFGFGNTLSMFDLAAQSKTQDIEVDSFPAGPLAVATIDGFAIVPKFLSNTTVAIDLAAPQNVQVELAGVFGPTKVAINPALTQGYILSLGDPLFFEPTVNDAVVVLSDLHNLPNLPGVKSIEVGKSPSDIAFPPLNAAVQKVVVSNFLSNTISVIDPANLGAEAFDLEVGAGPAAVVITSDGTGAYVANFYDNTVSLVDLNQAAPAVIATLATGNGPADLAIDASSETVFAANMIANTITVINGQSVVETIELPD